MARHTTSGTSVHNRLDQLNRTEGRSLNHHGQAAREQVRPFPFRLLRGCDYGHDAGVGDEGLPDLGIWVKHYVTKVVVHEVGR